MNGKLSEIMSTLTTLDCFNDFRDGHSSFVSIVFILMFAVIFSIHDLIKFQNKPRLFISSFETFSTLFRTPLKYVLLDKVAWTMACIPTLVRPPPDF